MVKNSIDDYKIAIIPSKGCEQLEEGEITYFGLSTFYFYHNLAFRDFCKKYYKEILNKQDINDNSPAELYAYYLQSYGNIVIANLTHARTIEKYGKEAMVFMPEEVSEKQKQSFETLTKEMDDYQISILYDMTIVRDNLFSNNIYQKSDEKPLDLATRYFDDKVNKKK